MPTVAGPAPMKRQSECERSSSHQPVLVMEPSKTMQQQQQQQQQEHTAPEGKDAEEERVEAIIKNIIREGITNEEVLNAYGSWAGTYEASCPELFHLRHLKDLRLEKSEYRAPAVGAAVLASVLGPDTAQARIMDIGAGTGLVGLELQKLGFTNVDALDASPQMLQVAKQKGIYKNLITALIGPDRLPIETDCYDAVTAVGCFVHGHVEASCFEELFRITKPGGHVVVVLDEKMLPFELFEATLQHHHDNGLCKWVERRIVPNILGSDGGLVYIIQALPTGPDKQ